MVDTGDVPTLVLDTTATASGGDNDLVHITNDNAGFYSLELTAAQLNYVGRATLAITDANNHCPAFHELQLVPANVYDALFGVDKLDVNTVEVGGTTQTAGDLVAAISGIGTAGGAAINQDAATDNYGGGISGVTSATTKVGTQTNTYTSTSNVNGVFHTMTHSGQVVDIVYQFLIGGGTQPVEAKWVGYLNPINDVVTVRAWNHVGGVWETVGTIAGQTGSTVVVKNFTLYPRHAGTSVAELGKVYLRFLSSAAYNHILNTDQVFVSYTVTSRTVGYADGAVWLDTVSGTAGTVSYVNGTADRPVNTIASALTLCTNLGLRRIRVAPGSSITLVASVAGLEFLGEAWTLALGGQNVNKTIFHHADVSGISSGVNAEFYSCSIGTATIAEAEFIDCAFDGTLTTVPGVNYLVKTCVDGIPGNTNPVFIFTAGTIIGVRNWSGGLNIGGMVAGNQLMLDGMGKLILNAGITGGEIRVRGNFGLTDNVVGGFTGTLIQTENFTDSLVRSAVGLASANIDTQFGNLPTAEENADAVWDEVLTGATHNVASSAGKRLRHIASNIIIDGISPNTGGNTNTSSRIELDAAASSMNGAYDPAIIYIALGTGAGQSRGILEYNGSTKIAYVDRDWKVIPDNTSEYILVATSFELSVNEGVAGGGSFSTIILNALASNVDELYTGQVVFIKAGTGADQSRTISAYDGSTRTATVDHDWQIAPDTTSNYCMMPYDRYGVLTTVSELARVPKSDGSLSLNATANGAVADKILGRSLATGADGGRTVKSALQFNRNKVVIDQTLGTITVYAEDDTTIAWSGTIATSATAELLTEVDPS
jgi:hypothetical protein